MEGLTDENWALGVVWPTFSTSDEIVWTQLSNIDLVILSFGWKDWN